MAEQSLLRKADESEGSDKLDKSDKSPLQMISPLSGIVRGSCRKGLGEAPCFGRQFFNEMSDDRSFESSINYVKIRTTISVQSENVASAQNAQKPLFQLWLMRCCYDDEGRASVGSRPTEEYILRQFRAKADGKRIFDPETPCTIEIERSWEFTKSSFLSDDSGASDPSYLKYGIVEDGSLLIVWNMVMIDFAFAISTAQAYQGYKPRSAAV